MAADDRIGALRERHASLEQKLQDEAARPSPDQDTIHDLKREKLALKDEIARLEMA